MAQPTVTQRPSLVNGATAPILYKLTSTNYANAGYRLEVQVWVNGVRYDMKCYADSNGFLLVDVSAFAKAAMNLANTSDLTTASLLFSDPFSCLQFYILYQEVWSASSEALVDDSANVYYALYGGRQVGQSNDLSEYHVNPTYKFLTLMDECQAIKSYPFTISAFVPLYAYLRAVRYQDGVGLGTVDTQKLSGNWLMRLLHKEVGDADKVEFTVVFKNNNGGAATFQNTLNSGTSVGPIVQTLEWFLPAGSVPAETYAYTASISPTADGGDFAIVTLKYVHFDNTKTTIFSVTRSTLGSTSLGATALPTPTKDVVALELTCTLVNAAPNSNNKTASITIAGLADSEIHLTDTQVINIADECDNTVMLQWKNSLGGDECYPFIYSQEYGWNVNSYKAKRLTLFADQLSINQWEVLQGLNTPGELYAENIIELLSTTERTMSKVGQAAYVYNSDGTKFGVVVINENSLTRTEAVKHNAVFTIEYPELLLQ